MTALLDAAATRWALIPAAVAVALAVVLFVLNRQIKARKEGDDRG